MAKWFTLQTYCTSLVRLSSFLSWVVLGWLYLHCPPEWLYLHPKTYPLQSSSGCSTIDYIIFPLPFWHSTSSAHPSRLIHRQQFPSILVLASWYYIWQTQSRCSNFPHFTTWKLQLNNHETATILFSKRNPPPPWPSSDPRHLCALGLNSMVFRPCVRIKTSLHQVSAHRCQQSHRHSL